MTSFESIENLHRRSLALAAALSTETALSAGTVLSAETAPSAETVLSAETDPEIPGSLPGKVDRNLEPSAKTERPGLPQASQSTRVLAQAQKMDAIGRVTGGIAHNFNNLLTGILGYCDLLAIAGQGNDTSREHLERISETANRCGQLVQQLLAFSQRQVLLPESVEINPVISESEERLRKRASENVEIVTELDADVRPANVDREQIAAMIDYLTVNAIEAMPDGGRVTLSSRHCEIDSCSIRHLSLPPADYALIAVQDTGCGIDEEIYDRIFEPFFSTKDDPNGTGLGLAMVYGFVQQSDGHIRVNSSPGDGTRFEIYLPIIPQQPSQAKRPAATLTRRNDRHGAAKTVLLAEDDPAVRQSLEDFLNQHGYDVVAVSDGAAGVEAYGRRDRVIDLLLTDIVMPRVSGLELAQQVLANDTDTRVLFISGYSQERDILCELVGRTEGVDFLQKPFAHETLDSRLRQLLGEGSAANSTHPRAA